MFSIPDFKAAKASGRRISMLTCYDSCLAAVLAGTGLDAILVGDTAAMVMHGHGSTLPATVGMIESHVRAVRAGAPDMCVIADMPFLSTRQGLPFAVKAAGRLMRAGANAVKIEGLSGHEELIPHLLSSGIPVMGHIGLTPQSVNVLGGYRVQGGRSDAAARLRDEACRLEAFGCFSIVLECVPTSLASDISAGLSIPTIGIGAGPGTDGQVLVLQDMLGLSAGKSPRFVRKYADGISIFRKAAEDYIAEVVSGAFPSAAESYGNGKEERISKEAIL